MSETELRALYRWLGDLLAPVDRPIPPPSEVALTAKQLYDLFGYIHDRCHDAIMCLKRGNNIGAAYFVGGMLEKIKAHAGSSSEVSAVRSRIAYSISDEVSCINNILHFMENGMPIKAATLLGGMRERARAIGHAPHGELMKATP
ncbi:hypothetical protein [Rhodovarius lipocyclicus]|uniref:hypothetical protein n=1 Tax=Rhodovarius lipocyclicus TaxID=268410 RepID=UPI00135C1088|nr:hypothetical protein [Rhodovarius lipocyclicus]